MAGRPWTPEEDDLLRRQWIVGGGRQANEPVADALGRTWHAVNGRAQLLGLKVPKEPDWTPAEIAYLQEMFWHQSYEQIAKRLGRTAAGVKLKAKRLGLRYRQRRELTPSHIGRIMHHCPKEVKRWIRKQMLPARLAPTLTGQKGILLVDPHDLVEFLRTHPEDWDARRCPNLHIKLHLQPKRRDARPGERPLWLKEKLAADIARGRVGKRWTPAEETHLARLMRRGLNYRQIGEQIGRSSEAVGHRLQRIGRRIWKLARGA